MQRKNEFGVENETKMRIKKLRNQREVDRNNSERENLRRGFSLETTLLFIIINKKLCDYQETVDIFKEFHLQVLS
jgi:hypothetical protein